MSEEQHYIRMHRPYLECGVRPCLVGGRADGLIEEWYDGKFVRFHGHGNGAPWNEPKLTPYLLEYMKAGGYIK
jgi:hypothetical protein